MPSHSYKPNLKTLRNHDVILEAKTVYTTRGPVERLRIINPLRVTSGKKRQSSQKTAPFLSQDPGMTSLGDQSSGFNASNLMDSYTAWEAKGQEPLKIRKTKV